MKSLYEKNKLGFALISIAAYCLLQSLSNPLNERLGIPYSASAVFVWMQAAVLWLFLRKTGLRRHYGLCRSGARARRFLYYLPLAALATRNLWGGVSLDLEAAELICGAACMLGVGFVEELLFRGLLFRALEEKSARSAIVISSVTFGLGHILNLTNGSGMTLGENLLQIVGAILVGFLFVLIFHRGGSLIPCIAAHAFINATSVIAAPTGNEWKLDLLFFLLTALYTLILLKTLPKKSP